MPTVGTGIERAKSQSVDYGKTSPQIELPLKSPPASAPLVQSARLFWNSIGNACGTTHSNQSQIQQQNHPQGSTHLHQQQYHRSRQRFINAKSQSSEPESSASSQSPFALVAGKILLDSEYLYLHI